MWHGNGEIYFACTNGGHIKEGQIFRYRPLGKEGDDGGTMELFVESKDASILSYADNLTISNYGDVIIAEDTYDKRSCRIVGITPQGQCYHIASNSYNSSELAGVCFSPDYKTLFVNIQKEGITVAIQGPWASRRVS
jgi:secreted PhoX family phosphatase